MANLPEVSTFDAGVYQIETSDPVLGGPTGISNLQAKALANRTKYLKDHVDALEASAANMASQTYVQDEIAKLDFKQSVRVATTANITLSGGQTIDGIALTSGDRVLVKNQTTGAQNGIYVVSASAWSRATDANDSAEVTAGMMVSVAEGAVNADTVWKLVTNDPITLGVTTLTFYDITFGYAPLNSPALTGNPTAPTPASGDNDTSIATTAFVTNAIDGMVTVNVAGGSSVALTAAQGGTGIIQLTGTITASFFLNLPAASGTYLIWNNTSGAFNITAQVTGGPGSSVVLPQGSAIIVFSDGTNVKAASSAGQAFLAPQEFTPANGTTTLTVLGGYTPGALIVTKNGAVLKNGDDYTATTSPTITLAAAANGTDEFTAYVFTAFAVANALPLSGGTLSGTTTMAGAPFNQAQGAAIASAGTVNLTSATGNFVHITGTTAITAITLAQGAERTVVFDGALTLTHGASLVLPGAANITTAAGDVAVFRGDASGVVRCVSYVPASGFPLLAGFAVSKSTSGYQKLPSGLVIQWGNTVTNGSGQADVTFPIAFPTALFRAIVNPIGGNYTVGNQNSVSASGFNHTIVTANTGATAPSGVNIGWFAVGH